MRGEDEARGRGDRGGGDGFFCLAAVGSRRWEWMVMRGRGKVNDDVS